MCPPYLIVTDRQTDGQTTYCGITALCIALLGYNSTNNNYLIYKAPCGCNFTGTELHWTHNKRVSFVVPHCKCHCYAYTSQILYELYTKIVHSCNFLLHDATQSTVMPQYVLSTFYCTMQHRARLCHSMSCLSVYLFVHL